MTRRVLITGSRGWSDNIFIANELRNVILRFEALGGDPTEQVIVVHGDCPDGADALAKAWLESHKQIANHPVKAEAHSADWTKNGKAAGHIRNGYMVKLGAEICVGFALPCRKLNCPRRDTPHATHGTGDCLSRARRARIETRLFRKGW